MIVCLHTGRLKGWKQLSQLCNGICRTVQVLRRDKLLDTSFSTRKWQENLDSVAKKILPKTPQNKVNFCNIIKSFPAADVIDNSS